MSEQGFKFSGRGRVERVEHFTSKAGKDIVTVIIAVDDDRYPQLVPAKAFGRLAELSAEWEPGAILAVNGHLGGRESNGRVWGDIIADGIEVVEEAVGGKAGDAVPPPSDEDDPGF
jgi:hypothetical protein